MSQGYMRPTANTRREAFFTTTAGATTEGAKFRSFLKMRLKKVHVAVVTAGTATGHGYDIYHGTTSIGTIALSTNTAGYTASSSALNREVASLEQVSVKSLADATGVAHVIYEFQATHDAVES